MAKRVSELIAVTGTTRMIGRGSKTVTGGEHGRRHDRCGRPTPSSMRKAVAIINAQGRRHDRCARPAPLLTRETDTTIDHRLLKH